MATKISFKSIQAGLSLALLTFCQGASVQAQAEYKPLSQLAPALAVAGQSQYPPGLSEGAGIWVNLWNYPSRDFEGYAEKLYASGIRNLFIQTSRSNTPAIRQPEELGQIIEACHKYKIRVIAWSFAELHNPKADAEKLIVAARFRSKNGERLDAIAPNLEKNLHKEAVEAYSKILREALGAYPMVAVVYSPLNRAPAVAITPWKTLAQYYDVIAPMAYWNGRYQTIDAYTYTKRTVERIRELTARPDVEVHVIGDGMGTRAPEIKEFLRGCADSGAQSASLYPDQITTAEQYGAMALYNDYMPVDARERLMGMRQFISQGLIEETRFDPSRPISRGLLFKLTAHSLKVKGVVDAASAYSYFERQGVIDTVAREYPEIAMADELAAPLGRDTAASFVRQARLSVGRVMKPRKGGAASPYMTMARPSRADRLFAAPAYASGENTRVSFGVPQALNANAGSRPLSYFDAVHLLNSAGR
ncbi:MAG TPA: hypothetical protein PLI59_02720 [Candidatus Obscuribacter sp.]|nr:hypothetical protein [Candidatus Obscuribacter sp.]HND69258.1 hypothetical protein [Candidatus Obscuribacter sp.]HNG18056.1 hypothetical protein [Candidatus Obscuribacter sp.]HNG73300.1 hypothetical protein [Candidatus Obscuribacter sp.]